jgi:hypothetical protein
VQNQLLQLQLKSDQRECIHCLRENAKFPTKPAVKGIPAIDNKETAVATAAKGSVFANPLKASKEVSLFIFSTQIKS